MKTIAFQNKVCYYKSMLREGHSDIINIKRRRKMDKIKLVEPEDIAKIIQSKRLKNIFIETGHENVYILDENKFFLSNFIGVFSSCGSLQKINMEDFDFSEITTMCNWFCLCKNLEEITFPIEANCEKLKSLCHCFPETKLQNIDLSFMQLNLNIEIDCFGTFARSTVKKITLPSCNIDNFENLFLRCKKLEEIIAPIYIKNKIQLLKTFYECPNLMLVNLSKGNFNQKQFIKQINNTENKNNLQNDCIVLLP